MKTHTPLPDSAESGAPVQPAWEEPGRAVPGWLANYLRENFMSAAWQASLAVGGVFLAVHFMYIGFFPELDWQASLALLAMVALTGVFILVLVCLLLTFPSFTWILFLEGLAERPKGSDACQSEAQPETADIAPPHQCNKCDEDERDSKGNQRGEGKGPHIPSRWRPSVLFGTPPAVFWSTFAFILWRRPACIDTSPGYVLLAMFATALVAAVIVYSVWGHRAKLGPGLCHITPWHYFPAAVIGTIVSFVPLLLLHALSHSRYNASNARPVTFLAVAALGMLFNVATIQRWLVDERRLADERRRSIAGLASALSVGAVLLLGVVATTNNWVLFPEGIARLYGLGNIECATLVLDKEGCDIAKAQGLTVDPAPDSGLCRLHEVTILNRLGRAYYLELGTKRFTMPTERVKSDELRK